jgi:hypothetical protein
MSANGITSFRSLKLTSKFLVSIFLLSSMAVLPATTATAAGEVLEQDVPEASIISGGFRTPYQFHQFVAPTSGSWNLVGVWKFNKGANPYSPNPNYDRSCSLANNSTNSNNVAPTTGTTAQNAAAANSTNNSWIAGSVDLKFNALVGYGDGVSNLVLRKRIDNTGNSNSDSGIDTGIKLSATIDGEGTDQNAQEASGCTHNARSADYYGLSNPPISDTINKSNTSRRTTETLGGVAFILPEEYFAVYRKNGATWTNTFSGLDPNTKYRFQFIHNGIGNLKEEVTSSASLNNGTPVVDSTNLVDLTTDPVTGAAVDSRNYRKNRITVTVLGYDTFSLTRKFTGISAFETARDSMVLNGFTIYEEAKTPTTTTLSVSDSTPVVGDSVTLSATVSPSATSGTVTFKDSSSPTNNTLCTTGTFSSGTATCTWTNTSPGIKTIRAIYSGSPTLATSTSSTSNVTWLDTFVTTFNATTNGGTAISPLTRATPFT